MPLAPTFQFEPADNALTIGFAPQAGAVNAQAEVAAFAAAVERRFGQLKHRVHLFFDLSNLKVEAAQVEAFSEAKHALCERYSLSCWYFGGNLAERVMTRNDSTRRGQRPNLFKTRDEALAAFRRAREAQP